MSNVRHVECEKKKLRCNEDAKSKSEFQEYCHCGATQQLTPTLCTFDRESQLVPQPCRLLALPISLPQYPG
jgi:hypothetical protein